MIKFTVGENQGNQRLDRFLKKYFAKASLSHIYKLIRKDIKLNGKRAKPETILSVGDQLTVYMSEEEASALQRQKEIPRTKKQFTVVYEDENILAVEKPFGLLTHGDGREKKNHLANQVLDYLIAKGDYLPMAEKTFVPSPANRLDRNTTGIVLFGKTAEALKELNEMLREREGIEKFYLTITAGCIKKELRLKDEMIKDEKRNMTLIIAKTDSSENSDGLENTSSSYSKNKIKNQNDKQAKLMDTEVFPVAISSKDSGYTLAEVKINTGRTHQIRAQLAQAGFPIIGDTKYGNVRTNHVVKQRYQLTTHLLHAGKIVFNDCREDGVLSYLNGREITCPPSEMFIRIKEDIFGKINFWRQ